MPRIELKNGTTYLIDEYAEPDRFSIILNSESAQGVLETLTEENLSKIQFLTHDGAVTGAYNNKLLCGYADHGDTLDVRINDADLVRHGLILDEDNRIVSAVLQRYAQEGAVVVDKLPDGDVTEYRYVNGEYIHDPLPVPEQPEVTKPTQEERIAQLEEKLKATEILLGVSE